ncbi:MAG: hypothetical protein IKM31_05015 [Oscillospiraceae bacterium]|nr:hypothetical protein [Oscillospiraceae bacterium]
MHMIKVATPSRICLFGEHQDYLGLEVIASAINLHFSTKAVKRDDSLLKIKIRDSSIGELGATNDEGKYEEYILDAAVEQVYDKPRDYFKSIVNVVKREGFAVPGADIIMDSTIPIGKGMCSSTTMVMALTATLVALCDPEAARDKRRMAYLAWKAEVQEFNEPGGMMDHYASALGGLTHMDFRTGQCEAEPVELNMPGCYILFDSLQDRDCTKVLAKAKFPTLDGIAALSKYGVTSIRDFYDHPELCEHLDEVDEFNRARVIANINDYRLQREALELIKAGAMTDEKLGAMLSEHQANMRDGLGISTPAIDKILETAIANGAYGGKFNGAGGGGCLYVYAPLDKADQICAAVKELGYPSMILKKDDNGLTVTVEE